MGEGDATGEEAEPAELDCGVVGREGGSEGGEGGDEGDEGEDGEWVVDDSASGGVGRATGG